MEVTSLSISHVSEKLTVLALRPDVVATVLDDSAVLLDLETKYFYALNASGWALAQLFEAGASVAAVESQAACWGAPAEDVERFIEALRAARLVEGVDDAVSGGDGAVTPPQPWTTPTLERQAEPLHQVIVSAFDPSVPMAE